MKLAQVGLVCAVLLSTGAAFASDSSEKIPAPTLELRPAGTLPSTNQPVVTSQIPSPTVEVVPQGQANQYETVDAGSTGGRVDYSSESAPSITVIR